MSASRRTVVGWAMATAAVVLVPIFILIGIALDTSGDTESIKKAQAEAQEASNAAVRNGTVSACTTTYAATYDGWIAEFTRVAADPVARQQAAENAVEMDRRRIGVAVLSRVDFDEPFECPEIPGRLVIPPWDPLDPRPPPPLG